MVKSGVTLEPDCVETYSGFKFKKQYDFVIYRMSSDNKRVEVSDRVKFGESDKVESFSDVVEDIGQGAGNVYKNFITTLTADNNCGYGVIDIEYRKKGQGMTSSIALVTWIPETATVKQKMLYSSTKEELKKKFEGISANIQITDFNEFKFREILETVSKGEAEMP